MAGRDRISELPGGILDKILGNLSIEEAARTSILSTVWRNIWSGLTQLNFSSEFFAYILRKYWYNMSPGLEVISKILMKHNGPIQKLVFKFPEDFSACITRSSFVYFDQWLLLATQKGVEEINFDFGSNPYRLPNCIFSCVTLKRLHLFGVTFGPINAPCILPNVTSLCFESADFGSRDLLDCPAKVPMLEDLTFIRCENTFYCNITAPKLYSFSIICCEDHDYELHDFLPVNLDLISVHTIELDCSLEDFVKEVNRTGGQQPPVLNVEYLMLSDIYFPDDSACSALIDLLQICPELSKLDLLFKWCDVESISKFVEKLPSVARTHTMFRTLELEFFHGWRSEMLFIEGILACFPALEEVIIIFQKGVDYNELEIVPELLRFPSASPKAKIVCL